MVLGNNYPFSSTVSLRDGASLTVIGTIDIKLTVPCMFNDNEMDTLCDHLLSWDGIFVDGVKFEVNDSNRNLLLSSTQFKRIVLDEVHRINQRHVELLENIRKYSEEQFSDARELSGGTRKDHEESAVKSPFASLAKTVSNKSSVVLEPCLIPVWTIYNASSSFRQNGMGIGTVSIDVYESVCELYGLTMTPFIVRLLCIVDREFIGVFSKGA